MTVAKRRYPAEEFARRGDDLFEKKVRPKLTVADEDKFAAIDIETGEFELDKNEKRACDRLCKRVADPQIWLVHVTMGYLHRFGGARASAANFTAKTSTPASRGDRASWNNDPSRSGPDSAPRHANALQ